MEEVEKRKIELEKRENDIVYSNSIKAGRRIYYLDVKTSRNGDMYLAITESKKKVSSSGENAKVNYEKHKIFLYKEDFNSFRNSLEDVINFIEKEQGESMSREEYYATLSSENPEEAENVDKDDVVEASKPEEEAKEETKKSFFDKFKF